MYTLQVNDYEAITPAPAAESNIRRTVFVHQDVFLDGLTNKQIVTVFRSILPYVSTIHPDAIEDDLESALRPATKASVVINVRSVNAALIFDTWVNTADFSDLGVDLNVYTSGSTHAFRRTLRNGDETVLTDFVTIDDGSDNFAVYLTERHDLWFSNSSDGPVIWPTVEEPLYIWAKPFSEPHDIVIFNRSDSEHPQLAHNGAPLPAITGLRLWPQTPDDAA